MKYSKILFSLLLLAYVVQACYEDEWAKHASFEEGNQVQVSLNFEVQGSPLLTRAAQKESFEYRVENVYLMIFDQNGQRVALGGKDEQQTGYGNSFFSIGKGLENLVQGDGNNPTNGQLRFKAVTVQKARIVGVANLTSGVTATAYSVVPADLDKVNTLEELQQTVLPMAQQGSIERGALFLMTGYAESGGSYDIDIKGSEFGSVTLNCKLMLRRVDARIEVNIKAQSAHPELWKEFSFEPRTWQVMQVPQQTLLLPAETANENGAWDADGENCKYFNTPERVFEEVTRDDQTKLYTGGSFTFYMPENRKQYKKKITATADTKATPGDVTVAIPYAYRDKQAKNADGTNQPQFEYANDLSTYLVLTGNLSYIDSKDYHVSTEARYVVHLGYVNKKNGVSQTPDVNDYETLRNGKYTYNLTVTGVNSIIQEVTHENEVRPGFEGHIVYSDKGIREFDAHYDRHLLAIPVSYVKEGLKWGVNTPFSSGIYNPAAHPNGEVPSGLKDYKWIKFAINKEYGVDKDHYVKYPGDQNYDDPDIDGNVEPSPSYPNHQAARLRDVHQITQYLKGKFDDGTLSELADKVGSDEYIYITAFLDENLYFKNPETGEESLALWKQCVDKSNRQLHIIYGEAKYSKDGQSSVVNSFYTFSQKSIRTVYNIEKESLKTAWGLESSMETDRLIPGTDHIKEGTDTRNGLANTLKWVVGKQWSNIIATEKSYQLSPDYNNAAFACMLRNRDLNGDNEVQAEEVRWYLASIDQLTDIYLGEYALDTEARLYPRNKADRPGGNNVYWHYTSSSCNSNEGGPWVLWAEEGASIGSYGGDGGSQDLNGPSYSYRCVRNLGIAHHNTNEVPEDLIKVTTLDNGNYLVDVSNMNVKSRRTNLETVQLPEHNELSSNNRPYEYFEVHKDVVNAEGKEPTSKVDRYWDWTHFEYTFAFTNAFSWGDYQNPGVQAKLPEGFRIPNQRELLIMTTRMPREYWQEYSATYPAYPNVTLSGRPIYISYTAFSMDGQLPYSASRDGFIMHSESMKLSLQNNTNETGYVRCVRDVAAPTTP